MRAAIIYATKHGTTSRLVERIAAGLGPDTEIHNVADGPAPDLAGYDVVVVGTPIYFGRPRKEIAGFLKQAGDDAFAGRRLGLFVSGMVPDPAARAKEFAEAFGPELSAQATATAFLPGGFDFVRLNALERFIIKRIGSVTDSVDSVDEAAISKFVEQLRAGE